jgi:hypothetical protein
MNAGRTIRIAIALFVAFTFATAASAAERNYWHHKNGHFENTEKNHWEEKAPDDNTYHFTEKERTQHYVELHDKSRDCWVRLYNDRCEVKFGEGNFEKFYDGEWRK